MCEHDRRRHQLLRFVARKTEHQSLIARALFGVAFAFRFGLVDALRNIGRLIGDDIGEENFVGVKNVVLMDVADFRDRIADDLIDVENGSERLALLLQFRNRDLAADDDHVAFCVGLAGNAAVFILLQTGIENGIGDGVANFVGVTFTDRLGGKDKASRHETRSVLLRFS